MVPQIKPQVAAMLLSTLLLFAIPGLRGASHIKPLFFQLLAAILTLLLFLLVRDFEGVLQGAATYFRPESFRLAWRSLIMLLGVILGSLILPPLSIPLPSVRTAIITVATTTAAAAEAAMPPFLFLLFPLSLLVLLWCVSQGSEGPHEEQQPPFCRKNCLGLTWRTPFLVLSFVLSCFVLQSATPATAAAPVAVVGVVLIATAVALSTIMSVCLTRSAEPEKASCSGFLAENV